MADLDNILIFVKVAQYESISRAARALGMPISTVSRRLSVLEAQLGVALLRRTTRRVSLTAPADQSSYRVPASFNLSAMASDSDGSISKVEFYQGSSLLRTLTQPPYSVAISQSAPGVYSYSAKATDNSGLAAQSSSIRATPTLIATSAMLKVGQWARSCQCHWMKSMT